MDRLEINDLMLGAVFSLMKHQGYDTKKAEEIYAKQRAVIEAEEIIKEVEDAGNN